MARLFISPREIQLINDLTKEYIKDVVGQKIYYYAVSTMRTQVHPVYEEATSKVFDSPVVLPVVASQPNWETRHNQFGMEQTVTVEFYVQQRDLLDKNLTLAEGDFFTYGDTVFEVMSLLGFNNIFGQEEYQVGYKFTGTLARPGSFDPKTFYHPQEDGSGKYLTNPVQHTFAQQRGLPENQLGKTGDVRQVRERLKDDMAPVALGEGPRTVDTTSATEDHDMASSFNNDPVPPKKGFYDE